ncbi:Uncharacterised protein [Mycobacteroides abscessus subsp. abscessus]|nr:Uncharacterised protein [Mycobacteroides abscessus subsp. abscessus]
MSPIVVSARVNRPPAPSPCRARNAASSYIDVASEHSSDPTMKIEMASRKKGLRP